MSNGELAERLRDEAEKAIQQLLAHRQAAEKLNLSQLEDLIGEFEAQLSTQVMQALVESTPQVAERRCPQCGGEQLRRKGQHAKRLVTQRGEIEVERDYMKCEACGHGFFPLG